MPWHTGDRVTVRAADWRVIRSTRFSDCEALDLSGEQSLAARTLLLPFDRPRSAPSRRPRVVSRKRWAHEVTALIRRSYPYGSLQYCPPAIRLLPYQIEPALAVLRHGALRLLLADEVGLGKTVEAGLVVREVALADHLSRTLILCPAALRAQWARELEVLFDLRTREADAAWLRKQIRELPADVNPWSVPGIYLASMDFVKRPEALHPLEDVRWDLVVVDEAHAATPGSHRRAAVHALACRARRLLLLTATPHSGDDEQFRALCEIGRVRDSPPVVLFNRSRTDVPLGTLSVRSSVLSVRPTCAEARSHELLEDYTTQVWTESQRRGDVRGELVATVLRKRALSSAASLAISVRRRLLLLTGASLAPAQMWLPLRDEDSLEDEEPDAVLGAVGLDKQDDERRALTAVAEAAEAAAQQESKVRALLRLVRRAHEPAIVFSEYRDTAERLCRHLADAGHRVRLLHGGLSPQDRRSALTAFDSGQSLLVSTDAASEGLNLHRACRLVVHFELPWSSSRLEQRCGRVNRIGQTRRVHEIALVGNHTSEELVLAPLLRRAVRSRAFSRTALMRQLTESRIASHVMGNAPIELTVPAPPDPQPFTTMSLQAEAQAETERLELLRRLGKAPAKAAGRTPKRGPGVPIARAKRHTQAHTVDLVVAISLRDAHGATFEHSVIGVSFSIRPARWHWRATLFRQQVEQFLVQLEPALGRALDGIVPMRLAAIKAVRLGALDALARREAEIQTEIRSAAQQLVQAGLFDRRAMRASRIRARIKEAQQDELAHLGWGGTGEPRTDGSYEVRAVLVGGCP
ncbi:MAG: DEAD/DEAH box helicase [Vicinamibacterales bacterium]